jgi:hypothetical protein
MLSETTGMATTSKNLPVSGIAAILPLAIFVVALVVEINSGINMPQNHNPPRLITSTAFTVGAGSSSYFRFSVPATATNVFVDGHFAATGGASNDIEVYVLNANEFVDFQNLPFCITRTELNRDEAEWQAHLRSLVGIIHLAR